MTTLQRHSCRLAKRCRHKLQWSSIDEEVIINSLVFAEEAGEEDRKWMWTYVNAEKSLPLCRENLGWVLKYKILIVRDVQEEHARRAWQEVNVKLEKFRIQ